MTPFEFSYAGHAIKMSMPSEQDHIAKQIIASGEFYEVDLLRALQPLLARGDLVLDVGANIGNHTVFFALVCGCRVISYEPNPVAMRYLEQNIQSNGLSGDVTLRQVAVGAGVGHAIVRSESPENLGAFSLQEGEDADAFPVVSLDGEEIKGPVKLLKIDVEGMEESVISGALHIIREHRPLIVCEAATEEKFRAIKLALHAFGYLPVAVFGATSTYLFAEVQLKKALAGVAKVSMGQMVLAQARLRDLASEHRETRKTVIKHTDQIRGADSRLGSIQERSEGLAAALKDLAATVEARTTADGGAKETLKSLEVEAASMKIALGAQQGFAEGLQRRFEQALLAMQERLVEERGARVSSLSNLQFLQEQLRTESATLLRQQAKLDRIESKARSAIRDFQARLGLLSQLPDKLSALHSDINDLGARVGAIEEAGSHTEKSLEKLLDEQIGTAEKINQRVDAAEKAIGEILAAAAQEDVVKERTIAELRQLIATSSQVLDASVESASRQAEERLAEAVRQSLSEADDLRNELRQQAESAESLSSRVEAEFAETTRWATDRLDQLEKQFAALSVAERQARQRHRDEVSHLSRKFDDLVAGLHAERDQAQERERQLGIEIKALGERHDALLNGRLFSTLKRIKGAASFLQRKRDGRLMLTVPSDAIVEVPALEPPAPALVAAPDLGPVAVRRRARMERVRGALRAGAVLVKESPLVTVVMTTYNSSAHVISAVDSILDQDYRNIELIVVDDASKDHTLRLLWARAKQDPRLRIIESRLNRGTYWSKNLGVLAARGSLITFMDSDDLSEPDRVGKQVDALRAHGVVGSTCNYVRRDESGSIVLNRGLEQRIGLISLMVKREVFDDIGYFDSIRTSADDEFMERIKLVYGRKSMVNVAEPLYVALLRENSLTTEQGNGNDLARTDVAGFLSAARAHFVKSYLHWYAQMAEDGVIPYVPFPSTYRPFSVHGKLRIEGDRFDEQPVAAFMATFPPRLEKLRASVASLLPQVDRIYIYLNGYESIPDFLMDERIVTKVGGMDLRDNGKIFHMLEAQDGYFLTVDDDIVYPADYVESLVRAVERHDRKAVVGVHGVILERPLTRYFSPDRKVFSFKHALDKDTRVNLLGTGTTAFHSSLMRPSLNQFPSTGMADVWMAVMAKSIQAPMVAVARPQGWLKPIISKGESDPTLYDEFRENDSAQTDALRAAGDWSIP